MGCTIGVSDITASRVLQPQNVPSGVSRTKKNAVSSGGVVRGEAKFRVFLMSDKHDRWYVSGHVARGFTLRGTSKPGPPLAASNSSSVH